MKNISNISDCYGCGVCAIACPSGIISLRLNDRGFLVPRIDSPEKCTNCGICLQSCAYMYERPEMTDTPPDTFSGWSRDPEIRHRGSSGGVAFELLRKLMKEGYQICAVRYNADARHAEHYFANDPAALEASIGSKYIQSHTLPAFQQLNCKDRFAVIGCPCQIDSLRRFIKYRKWESRFILIDFLCHGVPSDCLWQEYLKFQEQKFGRLHKIAWRNKQFGWRKSYCMCLENEQGKIYYQPGRKDPFYAFFLKSYAMNPACQFHCKYKLLNSAADIRLGDLWGTRDKNNQEGISGVIACTTAGSRIIHTLESCTIQPVSEKEVLTFQMKTSAPRTLVGKVVELALYQKIGFPTIVKFISFVRFLCLPIRIYTKLRNLCQ